MDLGPMRLNYQGQPLDEHTVSGDPFTQFESWFRDAEAAGVPEPNAMTLATVGGDGRPSARIVLLKGVDGSGFTFFTDHRSRKGRELAGNPAVALVFHWHELARQVRITGQAHRIGDEESLAYFRSHPVGSQHGAWASEQSSEIGGRNELERRVAEVVTRFAGEAIPLPPHWGGYRVVPDTVEFWQGRPDRLHDRILYTHNPESGWQLVRLSP
ncbi:MAG TPA: pyridoxamine 5'-phosphate oxidase [Gemmatimonadales bacterium]|nr:pyridoxamine 5'-phosphate oxidase [Gemmatimonadales bacterium]